MNLTLANNSIWATVNDIILKKQQMFYKRYEDSNATQLAYLSITVPNDTYDAIAGEDRDSKLILP